MRVDTRAGSENLIVPLRALGVGVEECLLPAGDVEVVGEGPGERPITVGIEYKSFEDVLTCVRNGRFAEQLRRMREMYEVSWLLVEGRLRGGKKGVETRRGEKWFPNPARVSYQEMTAWLMTMCQRGGVLLWRTEDLGESVAWLRALEVWWTAKGWEEHRAHLDWYTPPGPPMNPLEGEPSLTQRWARELPGVGGEKARRAGQHFESAYDLACASEADWVKIEGVGKKMAGAIVKAVRRVK